MSGGSGLWFQVCIPSQAHERERNSGKETEVKTPNSFHGNGSAASNSSTDFEDAALEQVLRKTLEELRIYDALWILDETKNFYKVTFPCNPGLRCDIVLTTLTTNGIGMCKGSTLGILPCSVLLQDNDVSSENDQRICETTKLLHEDKKSESASSTLSKTKSDIKKAFRGFKEMQKKFLQTVTARLTVAQVVEGVRAGAEPTFDFIMFVVVASMISALGLLENSSVVIVASMLISPIMGPILAGTFGAVIRDRPLRNLGVKTEIIGLFLCVIFGFLFGLLGGCFNSIWGSQNWPTSEMISRGQDRSLWIGALIALPSGVGVALSVLAGNAGSLVGVAISASLLPPAVNAGLLWGLAAIRSIRSRDESRQFVEVNGTIRWMKPSLAPNKGYEYSYFEEMDKEYALLGLISLLLTLVNIICIFIAAVAVLKIKEVAPRTSVSKTTRFWKEDIQIARVFNTTMPQTDPQELGNQFVAEWASLNGIEPDEVLSDDEEATITRMETLRNIIEDVEADEVFQTVTQSVVNKKDSRPLSKRLSALPQLGTSGTDKLARRRPSAAKSAEPEQTGTSENNFLHGVQLRRPQENAATPRSANRDSVAILRQTLMNSGNPYTLWPAAHPRPSWDVRIRYRQTMEPLAESSVVEVPHFPQRTSRFLHVPEVVVKETTC